MGPCAPWVTEEDLGTPLPVLPEGVSWDLLTAFASEVLFDLSGQRWAGDCGEVTATLSASCWCGSGSGAGYPAWSPAVLGGEIYNLGCCNPATLILPDSCARDVSAVTERGRTRPPGEYRLGRNGHLLDTSGRGWFACGGGVEVTYSAGCLPPAGGVLAARTLSLELGKAAAGDSSCRLPSRVTSVIRQGVTIGVLDRWQDLDKHRTGIYTVDLWLSAVTQPVRGAAVWSPDLPTASR